MHSMYFKSIAGSTELSKGQERQKFGGVCLISRKRGATLQEALPAGSDTDGQVSSNTIFLIMESSLNCDRGNGKKNSLNSESIGD